MILRFEDIKAWQKAQDLAVSVYQVCNSIKDYGFKDQLCRAAVSISNNIAEGFDRKTDADFSRFLYFSLASCSEVKSMLYLAEKIKYITSAKRDDLIDQKVEISKIITGLIKSIKPEPKHTVA